MAGHQERRGLLSRSGRRIAALSYTARIGILSGMDDEPRWREIAKAMEYWVLGALVARSMVYGLCIGIKDLVACLR